MNDPSPTSLVQAVHDGPLRFVLAVTGGGSGALSALLTVPGASRSVLAAFVPYAPPALAELLTAPPDESCSARTARAMAMAAYLKARQFEPAQAVGGVACTASLASDRPKRGPHRIHVAGQTADATGAVSLELEKGARTRAGEEALAQTMVLNALAEACGAAARLPLRLIGAERLEASRTRAPRDWQDLLAGQTAAVPPAPGRPLPRAVFPGAFNPLHAGHRRMQVAAGQLLGEQVAYEISIENVDKLPLDFIEIEGRLRQFDPGERVWLTRAGTFVEKAALFPGSTFVVGADTVERIGQERYYGDRRAMLTAIEAISRQGCRFLVFGRAAGGAFRALDSLGLPDALAALCRGVGEDVFREDISSTALRATDGGAP